MEKFTIELETIAHRWSEQFNEKYKCLYNFNTDNNNPPRVIPFNYIAIDGSVQSLQGNYSIETHSIDVRSNSLTEPIGSTLDRIIQSCEDIIQLFYKE